MVCVIYDAKEAISLKPQAKTTRITGSSELTQRQYEVLQAIASAWKEGHAPSSRELLDELGITTFSGLDNLLKPLSEKGFVRLSPTVRGRQRLIELTAMGRTATGFGLPVLGVIPAGPVAEAIQECDEWLDGATELFQTRPGDFALRVQGDSMTGDGILPDDRVLIRPRVAWRNGEIVAAQIRDEVSGRYEGTLKHIELINNGKTVRLRASNPAYADMEFDAHHVFVAGVYRGLIRLIQ